MQNWLTFKNISLSLLCIGIFTTMLVLLLNYKGKYEALESKPVISRQYEVDQLKVEFNYTGNSTWEYTLTGYASKQCFLHTTEVIVSESYPENVKLVFKTTEPDLSMPCYAILRLISETGTFNASAEAKFEFVVEEEALDLEPLESKIYEVDPFKVEVNYVGDSTWEYRLTGHLPNRCHSYTTELIVMESDPEQVKLNLTVIPQLTRNLCPEGIKEIIDNGTFSASEDAEFELVLKEFTF